VEEKWRKNMKKEKNEGMKERMMIMKGHKKNRM
jgi:hypothetical protein